MASTVFPVASDAINPTIVDVKGDLIAATAADAVSRLAVGANDTVLTADSAQATGMKWAAAATGGMTLITTTTWDNSVGTYTYSSLGSYKHLLFVGQNIMHNQAAAQSEWRMRFNGDAAGVYGYSLMQMNSMTYSGSQAPNNTGQIVLSVPAGSMLGAENADPKLRTGDTEIFVPDYRSAQFKGAHWRGGSAQDGTRCMTVGEGRYCSTSAITSVTLFMATGNFKEGTIRLYGVN
jgi:hypothetical protein